VSDFERVLARVHDPRGGAWEITTPMDRRIGRRRITFHDSLEAEACVRRLLADPLGRPSLRRVLSRALGAGIATSFHEDDVDLARLLAHAFASGRLALWQRPALEIPRARGYAELDEPAPSVAQKSLEAEESEEYALEIEMEEPLLYELVLELEAPPPPSGVVML
jgi:hypothetical protein